MTILLFDASVQSGTDAARSSGALAALMRRSDLKITCLRTPALSTFLVEDSRASAALIHEKAGQSLWTARFVRYLFAPRNLRRHLACKQRRAECVALCRRRRRSPIPRARPRHPA